MKTLGRLAALLISAQATNATIVDYAPTRDTYMRGAIGSPQLHGSSTSGRASKAFLDFYLSDYNRPGIVSAIENEIGHQLTMADMDSVELSLNLFSNSSEGYQPTALSRPAVFQGTQDWTEGSDTTGGAVKDYALYDPANAANNLPWRNRSGTPVASFFNLDKVENAAFEEWGGVEFTYRKWVLDDAVAFAYLTDPLSLGLFLNASDAGNAGNIDAQYNNTEVYSREVTDPSRLPYLELIIVPEPGSSAALMAGLIILASQIPRRKR